MTIFDQIILLLTGLTAIYMLLNFYKRYQKDNGLYDVYYMLGFGVLLVSGLRLIFLGWGILASPYVLTVATLIPLGISMGLMNQFRPKYKKAYSWFALVGLLTIGATSILGHSLKSVAVPLFHGVAGLIIFGLPIYKCAVEKDAKKGFGMVGIGGALIGIGGIALAFLVAGKPLLGIFTEDFIFMILAPLLFLMTLAFTFGFRKDIGSLK
jgi:FtsH-binding integral membrane protein